MLRQVLFVCSANYYRSRFAEHFFNWLAPQVDLPWRAESRGLLVGQWGDVGDISRYAVEALESRGIPMNGKNRDPLLLTLADLEASDLVVAVKESEHRPVMIERFPHWVDRVEYWCIHYLDCAQPDEAIACLERSVRDLVFRLKTDGVAYGTGHLEPRFGAA